MAHGYEPGEPVPLPDGTPRSTDVLHEALQEHIRGCDQCRYAIKKGPPKGFGQTTQMCGEYLRLIQFFADGIEL